MLYAVFVGPGFCGKHFVVTPGGDLEFVECTGAYQYPGMASVYPEP
jgi:hypothetical protein